MRPGSLGRNLIVAVLYFAFIGLWPLVVGYYVGRNRSGTAEKLSRLPGVSESGGLLAGIVVAIGGYLLLFTIVGAGAVLDTGTDTAADGVDIESTSDDVANQPSESSGSDTDSISEQNGGNTPEETDTSSATADGGGDETSSDSSGGTSDGDTNSGGDSDESNNTVTVEVVDVVDGDTMDIEYENGTDDTVRLIGVDTPEVYTDVSPEEYEGVPDTEPARQCLNRYGDEASAFAEQELASETVQLRFDQLSDRRGSFDRLLVYIMYDGENFNHLLIDEGLARVYDSTFTDSERFYDTEASEQENQTGVWSCRNAGDGDGESGSGGDGDGGSQTSGTALEIVEIHEDAEGEERENLNNEYVTFQNGGDNPLDLGGWVVEDEADHDYTVPDGFTLEAGAKVTLHTGQGENTGTDLYWGQGNPVWNNAGDTVYVTNADGETVIERSYE